MPNLPGSNPKKDVEMAKMMYQDKRFKPDFVKIYPTQVIPKTALYREWKQGKFETYDDLVMMEVLKKIKLLTPKFCRIDRLVRDISKKWVAGGTIKTNMRQIISEQLKKEGKICQCIRCREIKHDRYLGKPVFKKMSYQTVGGEEELLSFEKNEMLYSLLRLRLPNKNQKMVFSELKGAAIVREIHTFGEATKIGKNKKTKAQHKGLGKSLLEKAEIIARRKGYKKIAVISAIGTRNYYRKFGYNLEGLYMTKDLN
jgi:elongator complex protein 3